MSLRGKAILAMVIVSILILPNITCTGDPAGPSGGSVVNYIRDYCYASGRRFDLGRIDIGIDYDTLDFVKGDSIMNLSIYIVHVCQYYDGNCDSIPTANFWIDPSDTTVDRLEHNRAKIEKVDSSVFYFNPTEFWVQFRRSNAGTNYEIGVYIIVKRAGGDIDTIGNISETPYSLKLIRNRTKSNSYTSYYYEWRNIYYLAAQNFDPSKLEINKYKATAGLEDQEGNQECQDGFSFNLILGLLDTDTLFADREPRIDSVYIDSKEGLLIFPARRPFDTDSSFWGGKTLRERIPEIYFSNSIQDAVKASQYYIEVSF